MSRGSTIKESLARFEEKVKVKASECKEVKIIAQLPPIEKMDASLSTLACCEKLSISTNQIEKIANLNGLKCLKILSLGRNYIKSLTGLEAVADTLEELWISYNSIEKLKGLGQMKKLKLLHMSNNNVKDVAEYGKLADVPCLEDLVFVGNPLQLDWPENELPYTEFSTQKFTKLKKLDGYTVIRKEDE